MSYLIKNSYRTFNILLIALPLILISCEEAGSAFTADYSYELVEDNYVWFTNNSSGEYYSLSWDFGNGTDTLTTDKATPIKVYYPESGDYEVILKVLDFSGNTEETSKTINISKTDFKLSFTAEVDAENPNYINLENTSLGTFDSFMWYFRGDSIANESQVHAYFPFAGKHTIQLKVLKNGNYYSEVKSVTIAQDDPKYLENFNLIWADEFESNTVNTNNWTFETGAGGWGNNELQNYTNGDNAEIVDGKLVITARKVDDNKTAGSYTSTRMITKGKQEFKYGRMEIRAKLPSGVGIWPAIWMLGSNINTVGWPACGEIDILEYVGYEPNIIHSTVHTPSGYAGNGNGSSKTLTTCEEEFHVYGLIWDENQLVFYTDSPENITHTYAPTTKNKETWPFDDNQFFILNIAVGGTWGGAQGIDNSIFPQTLEVDYVRVYQVNNN